MFSLLLIIAILSLLRLILEVNIELRVRKENREYLEELAEHEKAFNERWNIKP